MAKTHPPSPPAFRAEAVALAKTNGEGLPQLAHDLGVSERALRGWIKRAGVDDGHGQPGEPTTGEREELRRLRREVEILQHEREIVRKAAASCAQETLCAASGSSLRSRPTIRSPSSAEYSTLAARGTTRGRVAGSRPAPTRTRRWRRRSRRSLRRVGAPTACRASGRLMRAAGLAGCHRCRPGPRPRPAPGGARLRRPCARPVRGRR